MTHIKEAVKEVLVNAIIERRWQELAQGTTQIFNLADRGLMIIITPDLRIQIVEF